MNDSNHSQYKQLNRHRRHHHHQWSYQRLLVVLLVALPNQGKPHTSRNLDSKFGGAASSGIGVIRTV